MTLREYIEENSEDIIAELCQYQTCENCSIGSLYKDRCRLLDGAVDEIIDEVID